MVFRLTGDDTQIYLTKDKREAIEDSTLVKHGGQPYDIARAIVFLADPESGYIDGETLDVDGGTSLD